MRGSELTVKVLLTTLVIVIVVGYGTFRLKDLVAGPQIIVAKPANGTVFDRPEIEISGQAKRISLISLNGRRIFTDKEGYFKETLLLADGYNIITLDAQDKFSRTISKTLRLVYVQKE